MSRGFLSDDHPGKPARLCDIAARTVRETTLAWLIFDGDREAWLAKSLVENNGDGTFTLPEWLAAEKGLI